MPDEQLMTNDARTFRCHIRWEEIGSGCRERRVKRTVGWRHMTPTAASLFSRGYTLKSPLRLSRLPFKSWREYVELGAGYGRQRKHLRGGA